MGLYPAFRLFTPDEYLAIERAATSKSEYMDGRIYAMAGSTRGHDAIAMNTLVGVQMRLRGKGCRAHSNDVRVSVAANSGPYYYPDVTVVCSAGEPDWRTDMVGVPILVCEVFSESTARYDQEVKLKQYRLMPSVRDILLIAQDKIDVQHHFRPEGQLWDVMFYSELGDSIPLAGLGIDLPIAEIYEGLGLTP